MPVNVTTDQYCSNSSTCGPYDCMETFINCGEETGEGGVLFVGNGNPDRWYSEAEVTPEQWRQIVELDREMVEVFNDYINLAVQILEGAKKDLPA